MFPITDLTKYSDRDDGVTRLAPCANYIQLLVDNRA